MLTKNYFNFENQQQFQATEYFQSKLIKIDHLTYNNLKLYLTKKIQVKKVLSRLRVFSFIQNMKQDTGNLATKKT